MRKPRSYALLALLLVGSLAACEDSSVVGPNGPEQTILDLMVDPDLTDAIIADVEAALDGVVGGAPAAEGALLAEPNTDAVDDARALLEQAREKFREARQAWIRGDSETAATLALEARMLVADAYVMVFGEEAYDRLLERVDHLISWLEERVDGETSELLDRIRELKAEAEPLKDTDLIAATERLILAVQIAHRERVHHRRQEMQRHARHSLFMADMALQLAQDVAGQDLTPEQEHAFRHALHLRNDAALALEAGRYRLSFVLSRGVVNVCLVVVMLEPDLPGDKVEAMIGISNAAIAAAEDVVDPTDSFLARLLEYIKVLQTRAIEISDTMPRRAIHVLWHVSVTAYGIVEMASTA